MRASIWIGMAAMVLAGCGSPEVPATRPDPSLYEQQARVFVEALAPRRDGTPVVAILARNEATETTDFLLTHAVLQRSGVAEITAVAPREGRVSLYPALAVDGVRSLAAFDEAHPGGADYVIVPAMDDGDDPAINSWLRRQSNLGARIVGVCAGALIVGRAGLLDGRRFVTHWFYVEDILERHPDVVYVPHQRYVVDGNVATTTGITASVPAMLALVEAIGGRERAEALATELGVSSWAPVHDSSRFGLNLKRMTHFVLNKLAFWRRRSWVIDARDGMDDVALAFVADAWSRTGQGSVQAVAPSPVKLRSGLILVTSPAEADAVHIPLDTSLAPVRQLDRTLCELGELYGAPRRDWVMNELEYPLSGDELCAGK